MLLGILALAAVLRFVGLDGRGTWDADQGHDMLVLRAFAQLGEVPLLGPPTSIGTFHHGALYYWLLAPAAWLSGADPTGVTAAIALAGLVTVAATWWLARQIGGPLAGHAAALLTAVSPAAIEQSTFIWNPNLIPAAASLGLAAAWRARTTGRARWWIVAAVGVGVVMQCHILGVILLPPVLALLLADAWSRRGADRARVLRAGAAGAVVIAAMYLPLLVHELTHDFAESRAIVAWLTSGGEAGPSYLARLPIVGLRVLAWPLAGLVSDRPLAAVVAALVVVLAVAFRWLLARGAERSAVRWLAGTLVWAVLALTLMAPSLATIVPGLPNDHYHAFADPVAIVLVALAVAGLARSVVPGSAPSRARRRPGLVAAGALVAVVLAVEVTAFPPLRAWDGGWPAAEQSADRVATLSDGRPIRLVSLPSLKSADAVRFPLVRSGVPVREGAFVVESGTALVIVCDPRFAELLADGTCDGSVDQWLRENFGRGPSAPTLVEAFVASPQRVITVFRLDAPSA